VGLGEAEGGEGSSELVDASEVSRIQIHSISHVELNYPDIASGSQSSRPGVNGIFYNNVSCDALLYE